MADGVRLTDKGLSDTLTHVAGLSALGVRLQTFSNLAAQLRGSGVVASAIEAVEARIAVLEASLGSIGDLDDEAVQDLIDAVALLGDLSVLQLAADRALAQSYVDIARDRGWSQVPIFGESAVPEGEPASVVLTRASAQYRVNAKGLLSSVAVDSIAHGYDLATGAYLGWALEPARTNSAKFSEELDNTYWLKTRGTISDTNIIAAPDGALTAEKFEEDTQDGAHGINPDHTIAVAAAGEYWTSSIFVKAAERTEMSTSIDSNTGSVAAGISARFDLAAGEFLTVGSGVFDQGAEEYPDGWWRVWITADPTLGAGNLRALFLTSLNDDNTFVGVSGDGLYWWGAQIEKGIGPSAYIKTTSAAATRAVNALSATAGDCKEGTLFARFSINAQLDVTSRVVGVYVNGDNRAHISINSSEAVNLAIVIAGNSLAIAGSVATIGEEVWVAASWKDGEQRIAVNGVVFNPVTPLSGDLAGNAVYVVGSTNGSADPPNAHVLEHFLFPRASSAAELAGMSTPNFSGTGTAPGELTQIQRRAWASAADTTLTAFSDFAVSQDVELVVALNPDMWNPVYEGAPVTTTEYVGEIETYFSTKQTAAGLAPNTLHYWGFRKSDGTYDRIRSAKTLQTKGIATTIIWGVMGCTRLERSTEHDIFLALASHGFDFIDHNGDLTYPGPTVGILEANVGRHRDEIVRQFLSSPSVSRLFETTALGVYMTDNHDHALGQWTTVYVSGDTFEEISEVVRQVYRETVPVQDLQYEQKRLAINAASMATVTLTRRRTTGRLRLLYPDMISQWNTSTPDTHLGVAHGYEYWNQKQWLFDQIDEAEADDDIAGVVINCSDTWMGAELSYQITHPAEWEEICNYIRDNLTKPFLLICGDGHAGGGDDGTNGDGSDDGKGKFPVVMASGTYQATTGSNWDVGPFSWDGVDTGIFDSGSIFLYGAFKFIDDGVSEPVFEFSLFSAAVDADTKTPTNRGTYRTDDVVPEVSFAETPYTASSGASKTITVDKTWFGRCSVDYEVRRADNNNLIISGTLDFGANRNRETFAATMPTGGVDAVVTLSNPDGCTIAGTNPVTVTVT